MQTIPPLAGFDTPFNAWPRDLRSVDLRSVPPLESTPGKDRADLADLKGARETAVNFEGVFLSEMFKMMFDTLPTDGPFGGGTGEAMFRPLLIDQYTQHLSRQGGIGLSDAVHREMLKLQEEANS